MKKVTLSLLAAIILVASSFAVTPDNERSLDVLYLVAHAVESDDDRCKDVLVTIEADGTIVDEFVTNRRGTFEYFFEANTYYRISMSKEGYVTKCIDINTYTHKLKNDLQEFSFYVEMSPGSEEQKDDIAKIFFPKEGKKFKYSRL